jgi:hypothetical protein
MLRYPSSPLGLAVVLLATAGAARAHAQAGCAPHGATQYICGVNSVEDLIRIDGTDWVLASELGPRTGTGGFYLIDVRTRAFHEASPDFSGAADKLYSKCPGSPDPKRFAAHGIAIRFQPGKVHQAYAVNHGGRESIEVFDLDVSGTEPKLIWRGCAMTPENVSGNSVTPLPDHGFAVTSFGVRTDKQSMDKVGAGQPSGFVVEWSPAKGWMQVPGTEFSGDNGIVASADGTTLYIAGWGDRTLHVVSRGKTPPTHRAVPLPGFHPDNIRYAPDGALLIAGQAADAKAILGCLSAPVCAVDSKVVRVDPKTFAIRTLVDEPANPDFGGTAGAIIVGNEVWLGPFKGSRVARVKLSK